MKLQQLKDSLLAKITAFFLLALMAVTAMVSICGGAYLYHVNAYQRSETAIVKDLFESMSYPMAGEALRYYYQGEEDKILKLSEGTNVTFDIRASDGSFLFSNRDAGKSPYLYTFFLKAEEVVSQGMTGELPEEQTVTVTVYIRKDLAQSDEFLMTYRILHALYPLRYAVWGIGGMAVVLGAALFVFLISAAGYKKASEEIVLGGFNRIPFDLYTCFYIPLVVTGNYMLEYIIRDFKEPVETLFICMVILAGILLFTAYCMNLAVRAKANGWKFLKNTVVYRLLVLLWKGCRLLGRGIAAFFRNLPLIWKTTTGIFLLTLAEILAFAMSQGHIGSFLAFWVLEKIVLVPVVLAIAIMLRRLQKGGEQLAAGDLSYQVDTRRLMADLKQHGENLNSIGVGMARAVEERLKSERLKTELITNVSHDIKTPLTSIINYVDLLGKEETNHEKIREYVEVLSRQSERLKKLIEDLVEASKAATGNVDVLLAPCEAGVLLAQTVGEYERRAAESSLELMIKQPDSPVSIMADGRLLWRVFDNLMNNVCKYALPSTRVYLNLEVEGDKAVISFKNISRSPLNISPEELMGRFVRGDSARHTEGNGLGLSIARSLTELQNGTMRLTIDGDLFKVTLEFPIIPQ